MKKRESETVSEKVPKQEKPVENRPSIDFNKPMSLGDFNDAFQSKPFN